jgi:hypothetical protein
MAKKRCMTVVLCNLISVPMESRIKHLEEKMVYNVRVEGNFPEGWEVQSLNKVVKLF